MAVAEELDEWVCRHRESADYDSACPVTTGLARMTPAEELQQAAELRRVIDEPARGRQLRGDVAERSGFLPMTRVIGEPHRETLPPRASAHQE